MKTNPQDPQCQTRKPNFWKEAEKADRALNDLKLFVEDKIQEEEI